MGSQWKLLVMTGIYTGLRLGDCCRLKWDCVNIERGVIQVIPEKTKKHAHGHPVTIPIHRELNDILILTPEAERKGYVNPPIADAYIHHKWRVDDGLRRIFKAANITMSFRVEGRSRKSVVASFHSLRHTFVSFSANAGVPLPVVQSIVGHTSTAMTRHYYHENEEVLRQAVEAIPAIGRGCVSPANQPLKMAKQESIPLRLKRLDKYLSQGLISQAEHNAQRVRILREI